MRTQRVKFCAKLSKSFSFTRVSICIYIYVNNCRLCTTSTSVISKPHRIRINCSSKYVTERIYRGLLKQGDENLFKNSK